MKAQVTRAIAALKACFIDYAHHFKLFTLAAIILVSPGFLSTIQQWYCGISCSTSNILLTIGLALLQNIGNVFFFTIINTKQFNLIECLQFTRRVFTLKQSLVILSIELINFSLTFYGIATQCHPASFRPCIHFGPIGIYSFGLVILILGYFKNFFILAGMENERPITAHFLKALQVLAAVWFVPPLISLINTGIFNIIPFTTDFFLDMALTLPLMYPLSNIFMLYLYKAFA